MAEQDMDKLLEEFTTGKPAVERQALVRYSSTESYQSRLQQKYQDLHHWYYPKDGDQWPQDRATGPAHIHVTVNMCRPVVDIDARLQSILPRCTLPAKTLSPERRNKAEATEAIMNEWLDASGWDVWLHTLTQTKALYGKGVLKPYWDDTLQRGDVSVVENPANLRIGWGSSDYNRMDWAIYEYSLSHLEVMARWPHVRVEPGMRNEDPPNVIVHGATHDDPLDQKGNSEFWRPRYRQYSDYERKQIKVWDYWYKDDKQVVYNTLLVGGKVVEGPHKHPELPDIPYIVIENDHEPGSPEGISTIEGIIDLQEEMNRLMSNGFQHIFDDVLPAWYVSGPSADTVEPGGAPKAGEYVGMGENNVNLWPKGVNTFPITEMIGETWNAFHRLTGVPPISFGDMPGADTSGRAVAIQVESVMNRMGPRRARLYRGLKELLVFWTIMTEHKNPSFPVDDENELELGELVKDFRNYKIIAPEITPRDNAEIVQNELNKVNGKLSSLRTAMDRIGVEAPEAELEAVSRERTNIDLFPESVQAKVSIYPILQQVMQQAQQMGGPLAEALQQGQEPPQSVLAQAQGARNNALQAQQGAQPVALGPDQNEPGGPGLPTTLPGSAPPQGAGVPGGGPSTTTLIRGGEALNQIRTDANPLGG
jgi:hypothetical protein